MQRSTLIEKPPMNATLETPNGALTMKGQRTKPPILLHALPDTPDAAALAHYLEARKCVLFAVHSPDELRLRFLRERPTAVLLPATLGTESAWLMTAKLRTCDPDARVVVLCESATAHEVSLGRFVGAGAVMSASASPAAIGNQLFGPSFGCSDN